MWHRLCPIGGGKVHVCGGVRKCCPHSCCRGLMEDETSMVRWAIVSFRATCSGALAIFNFWFGEPPSFGSPLMTCV
jgi:hypothetical protein